MLRYKAGSSRPLPPSRQVKKFEELAADHACFLPREAARHRLL